MLDIIGSGARPCGRRIGPVKGRPLVEFSSEAVKRNLGLAITKISQCASNAGHWEYKSENGTFLRVDLNSAGSSSRDIYAVLLLTTSSLIFN